METEPHTFTVEELLERYMRRFHEGPSNEGPLPASYICDSCHALAIYLPEFHSVALVDFPPTVAMPRAT